MSGLQSGSSPPPEEGRPGDRGAAPPEGTTCLLTNATTAPKAHTDSDNGCTGTIKQLITIMASNFPSDAPEQLYLALIEKFFTDLKNDQNRIKQQVEEIYSNISNITQNLSARAPQDTQESPTWSNIARSPPSFTPLLRRQASPATATAATAAAAKPPPQHYMREIIAHCTKARDYGCAPQRLVEDLNRASAKHGVTGQLDTARRLPSGDVVLRFNNTESRDNWREREQDWVSTLGEGAYVKQRQYTVIVHGMKKRECQDAENTIAELYSTNPRLKAAGVQILRASFQKRTLQSDKAKGPLLVSVAEPEQANEMVRQEINWRWEAHHCELFEGNTQPTQCFQCYKFGHIAKHCRHTARCGFCTKSGHESNDCDVKDNPAAHRCANCKGNHTSWHSDCQIVAMERKRSQVAYDNRPVRYRVDSPHQQSPGTTSCRTTYVSALAATAAPDKEPTAPQPQRDAHYTALQQPNSSPEAEPDCAILPPAPRTTMNQPTPNKRARMSSQNFIYVASPPATVETDFATTIKNAQQGAAHSGRSMRRGKPVPRREYCDNSDDTEMSGTTPILTTDVL